MNIDNYEFPELKPFDQNSNWAHKYCYDVLKGNVPACENIKLAAKRHFSDLERDDIYWCEKTANSIVAFFKFVPITDGKDVGKPTVLLPWQIWVVCSLVAWKWSKDTYDEDGNPKTVKGERRYLQAVVLISRKAGKALALDTPIPTPDGWTTMGDIKEGDKVFDEDGNICNVTDVTDIQHNRNCYKMTFSNGETVIADADHQWLTTARVDRPGLSDTRTGRYTKNRPPKSVRTTQEIFESLTYGVRGDNNHSIDMGGGLVGEDKDITINPYVLGYWLGDGDTAAPRISVDKPDLPHLISQIEKAGYGHSSFLDSKSLYRVTVRTLDDDGEYIGKRDEDNLALVMRREGLLSGRKFIPKQYMRASFETRLSLLQGLMDSDGTICKEGKTIEFYQTKDELTFQVEELIASLGIKYRIKKKYCKQFDSYSYRITFVSFADEAPVFRLPRKLSRMKVLLNCNIAPRSRKVIITGCEPVDSVPVKCIAVDSPNRLYRFGKTMLVTHNTTLAAGVVLWLMIKSGHQPRAYCVATKRDQAKLMWQTAKIMIKLSPRLSSIFEGRANDILMPKKDGVFKPLASDSQNLDGLNSIAIIGDEGHAWKDDNLYNVSVSSFGAQTEYLMLMISTAGFLLDNILVTLIKNGERVLRGDATQDHFFYAIFQIDKDDDWTDINSLYKANAGMIYGLPSVRYIKNQLSEAKMNVVQKANFLTKHANLFVNSSDTWLNFDDVVKCSNPELDFNDYKDKKCFVGVDRALVGDITSCVPLFPDDDGGCTIFPFNMQSKGAFDEAGDYLRSIYMKAEDSDDLEIINGNTVRNTDVKELIRYLWNELTQCEGFYYDPYHMKEVAMELESEGIPMIAVSQGTGNMAEPSLKLESLIKEGLFRYNGSTLFEFGVSCAQVGITKNNNMHVYRDTSSYKTEKIDPLIATIIALSGATLTKQDEFCYNDRGMLFL